MEDRKYLEEQQKLQVSIKSVASEEVKINDTHESDLTDKQNQLEEDLQRRELEKIERENNISKRMYSELNKEFNSVLAIIEIPNSNILFPIVQGEDNEFYLNHGKDGEYHPFGEVFLDYINKPDFSDYNTVIYGHNIRSAKAIFNALLHYENQEYYDMHKFIKIHNGDGLSTYQVVSVFRADPDENYREVSFKSDKDFNAFLDEYHKRSVVQTDPITGDNMITLSTCFTNDDRLVIQAVKINR